MKRCSPDAYAMCPDRDMCGSLRDAVFCDGSDCEEFNEFVEKRGGTRADRIRSMSDIELAEFLSTMVSSCDYCVHDKGCTIYTNRNRCREGVLEYLKEGVKEAANG